jgi:N-dimethylarginine dimethylaminohydrolase
MSFGVWNDYGRLREVAVGTAEGVVVPGFSAAYPPALQEITRKYAGKPAASVPELAEMMNQAQKQLDNLAQIYSNHGVIVHRPRPFTEVESGYLAELQVGGMQLFPADPIWVVGRHAIECQFRQPSRNKERFPLRELLAEQIERVPEMRVAACPVTAPDNPNKRSNYFLEGGDIVICGNKDNDILVGVDEVRSSSAQGAEWLGRYLADDGYRVTPVRITRDAPVHLAGAIGVVGPEAALIHRPSFIDGIPEAIKKWDLIDIDEAEAHAGGPCLVMINSKTILVPEKAPRISDLLAKRGLQVISIPFDAVTRFDGAIRCATFVMCRDKQ